MPAGRSAHALCVPFCHESWDTPGVCRPQGSPAVLSSVDFRGPALKAYSWGYREVFRKRLHHTLGKYLLAMHRSWVEKALFCPTSALSPSPRDALVNFNRMRQVSLRFPSVFHLRSGTWPAPEMVFVCTFGSSWTHRKGRQHISKVMQRCAQASP